MAAVLAISAVCGNVFAFGLLSFPKPSKPASATNGPAQGSAFDMQNKLVSDFVLGQKGILDSQAKMATALGDEKLAAKLTADSTANSSGATKDNIGRSIILSEESSKLLGKEMTHAKNLTAAAKAAMGQALPGYITGVVALIKMKPNYQRFMDAAKQQIESASMMDAMTVRKKLAVGTYVATKGPGYAESLAGTTGDFISYAKSHNISIPANATAALGSM